MAETWFFIMTVERDRNTDKIAWYWSRFGQQELQSELHATFEACMFDAKAHGFTFAAPYHVVTETDGNGFSVH